MEEYTSLGLGTNKYNQISMLVVSFLMLVAYYFSGFSDTFWLIILIIFNVIILFFYPFSDIKYSSEVFIMEKLFSKKEVSSKDFISVEKRPLNIFIIKFTDCKFYYFGDPKSFFEDTSNINERIKARLNSR